VEQAPLHASKKVAVEVNGPQGKTMISRLKAVLAEDEPVLRAELRELLARLWPELAICAEAEDGIEAIRAFEQHAPDILFLDIEMPGMTGIDVAQQLAARVHIVFVTAYDKFALAAFEQGAVDYVLKPFSAARLMTTVARLKQKVKSAPADLDGFLRRNEGLPDRALVCRARVGVDPPLDQRANLVLVSRSGLDRVPAVFGKSHDHRLENSEGIP